MPRRRTLRSAVSLEGCSLLSAAPSRVEIAPATFGRGILFARAEHPEVPPAGASHRRLVPAPDMRTTSLALAEGVCVHTVEHLLSALAALGITDSLLTLRGEALPIFDGSALPFFEAAARAGIEESAQPVAEFTLDRPVRVDDPRRPGAFIEARPRAEPGCSMTYAFRAVGEKAGGAGLEQTAAWDGTTGGYAAIAPARTFSFASEVRSFKERGLFTHLSPRDLLVVDDATGLPVENVYRFPDELARHKLLDLIGDLALLGRPLRAEVVASRSGHELNHALVRALAAAFEG